MSTNAPFIFQVNKNDFGVLFIDLLKLEWAKECPFSELIGNYKAGDGKATDDLKEIAENDTCKTALNIIAKPLHRTIYNTGGSVLGVSYLNVYSNKAIDKQGFVSITPSFEDSILIQYFDSSESYAQWFADTVSMSENDEVQSYLPVKFPLESLVFVLHAIDCFKRISFKSMLDYKPTDESMISSKEYGEMLKVSAESKDVRWLLPAFSMMTPNLERYKMNLGPDHMKILTDEKIFTAVKKQDSGEEFFLYTEAGQRLGVEFYSSWMMGIGFESVTFGESGAENVKDNGFIAPTVLGNHFFQIEEDDKGNGVVDYSVMTYEKLINKVNELLQKAVSASSTNKKVDTSKCANCDSSLDNNAKFCAKCGTEAQ